MLYSELIPAADKKSRRLMIMLHGLGDSIELTWQTGWTYLDEKDQTEKNAPDNSLLGV